MTQQARQVSPISLDRTAIVFRPTEDEDFVIRKAAELQGLSVTDYIRAAILDRAERDLHEHAALSDDWETVYPATSAEPLTSLLDGFQV
jgi:uncharacterized protein (DUF1778 family)